MGRCAASALAVFVALALLHLSAAQNACATSMTVCQTDKCDNSTAMTQCSGAPMGSQCNVPGSKAQGACLMVSPTLACYPQCFCRPNPDQSACKAKLGQPCVTQKYLIGAWADYTDGTCQCLLALNHQGSICYALYP